MGLTVSRSVRRPARRKERAERLEGRYRNCHGDHELALTGRPVTAEDARAVASGTAEFALVVEEPVIVLCARFGTKLPWTAARVDWFELSPTERRLPPPAGADGERRALLHVTLTDAEGVVRAERNLTLWLDFSRALNEAIREQAYQCPGPRSYHDAWEALRRRWPTAEALADAARVRGCASD